MIIIFRMATLADELLADLEDEEEDIEDELTMTAEVKEGTNKFLIKS